MASHPTRIGILGGGQLARMIAMAGLPLGISCRCFDEDATSCASAIAPVTAGRYDDPEALRAFARSVDAVTYEFENVPAFAAEILSAERPVYPPPRALEVSQDRLIEKNFFRSNGIETAEFAAVDSLEGLRVAATQLHLPAILKTRRMGYDGKGQVVLHDIDQCEEAWTSIAGMPAILEAMVPFRRELSLLAVRGRGGELAFYPLVENVHRGGILRQSIAPAPHLTARHQAQAEELGRRVLESLGYVGVLAIELFDLGEDRLLANEMAPRVHNSGHWSIEGAVTSQFENHLRAVCGLPLGSTEVLGVAAMVNLIGGIPPTEAVLRHPGAKLHLYGKAPRAGRKVGHITTIAANHAELHNHLAPLRELADRFADPPLLAPASAIEVLDSH
jgi:5-(carboxyamino)imidazole ribonucleotide synthase